MSHHRFRRRIYRLLDYFSFQSSFSLFHLRSALASAFSFGSHGRDHSRTFSPGSHYARKRNSLGTRRLGALFGVLLAVSLEVCGCELEQGYRSRFNYVGGDSTMRTVLAEQRLSFYDPVEQQDHSPSNSKSGADIVPPVRPPLGEAKPLPWAIPESVYFVYKGGDAGSTGPGRQPIATAFVLSIPDYGHRRFARFVVTARHVVDPEWARCSEKNPPSISLRLNRRAGGIGYVSIPLLSREIRRYFTPYDAMADLAIIPLNEALVAHLDEYKIIDVPFRLLPTDSEILQFRANQPIITARVPPWPSNGSSSFPVFDAGVLSKMPSETVKVQCGSTLERHPSKSLHLWFISAGTPQGASGAPVYTAIARGTEIAKTTVLLGVQSIAWPDEGGAGITPSVVLRDLVQTALHKNRAGLDFYTGPGPWPQETASLY